MKQLYESLLDSKEKRAERVKKNSSWAYSDRNCKIMPIPGKHSMAYLGSNNEVNEKVTSDDFYLAITDGKFPWKRRTVGGKVICIWSASKGDWVAWISVDDYRRAYKFDGSSFSLFGKVGFDWSDLDKIANVVFDHFYEFCMLKTDIVRQLSEFTSDPELLEFVDKIVKKI